MADKTKGTAQTQSKPEAPKPEMVRLLNTTKQLISFEVHDGGQKMDQHLAGGRFIVVKRGAKLGPDVERLINQKILSFRPHSK